MTNKQESIVTMWKTVKTVMLKHQSLWGGITVANNRFTSFTQIYDGILSLYQQQNQDVKGHTNAKKEKREIASKTAFQAATAMRLYATDSHNLPLMQQMKKNRTSFSRLPDIEFVESIQSIHDKALELNTAGVNLADYNLSPQEMIDFQTQIDEYNQVISAPRITSIQKNIATQELAAKLVLGNNILKELDDIFEVYATTQTAFYNAYTKARNIIEYGSHHTNIEIEVIVFDTDTGKNLTIAANIQISSPKHSYTLITDKDNKAMLKLISPGDYTVHIEAEGYLAQNLPLHISSGKKNQLKIALLAA